jgi:hypothetical protein
MISLILHASRNESLWVSPEDKQMSLIKRSVINH